MSLAPVIRGTPNDVIWGTNGVFSSGRIMRGGRTRSTEKDLSLDNNGVPTGSVTIPALREYEFEMECQTSTNLPSEGDEITILGDANCVVDSVQEMYERKGRKRATIRAHGFPS